MRAVPAVLGSLVLVAAGCADDGARIHCDEDGHCIEHADETEAYGRAFVENLEDRRGKEDSYDCSGVRLPDRAGFSRRIALTFDDGPHSVHTPAIIDVLRAHDAPATFFVNGVRMTASGIAIAQQIADDPLFILANHSQNHVDLKKMATQQGIGPVQVEMDRTDEWIRATGETPKYFRFPFGSSTCATKQLAESRGWMVTGWTIDSADWCYGAGGGYCKKETFAHVPDHMRGDMIAYILSQVRQHNGGVILLHDIQANTARNLDRILTALEEDGFTFVGLDDASTFPKLNKVAERFIGDPCTSDADCLFTAGGQEARCHAAGFCTIECVGTCPDRSGKAPAACIAEETSTSGGTCVSRAHERNDMCGALPGTVLAERQRFDPLAVQAIPMEVCAPAE